MQAGAAEEVPIKTLLITVFESIAEVFLLCIAGYTLAYTGVTDKATQRKLNVINVSLFTPALLFSKVAFSLTPSKLREMWIIPLGFVLITGVSAVVAWVMSKMFKLKKSQTAFAICAAMFQNSNSLPIALVQSLVADVPGLKWGTHDSKDQMLGRALTYMVLYSTLGMVLRWSYGVKLLANADDEDPAGQQPAVSPSGEVLPEYTPIMSPEPIRDDPFLSLEERAATNRAIANRSLDIHAASAIVERGRQHRSSQDEFRPSSLPLAMRSPFGSSPSRGSPMPRRRRSSVSRSSSTRRPAPSRTDSGREFWNLPEQPRRQTLVDLAEDSSESEAEAEDADEWGTHDDCCGPDELPLLRRRTPPPMSPARRYFERVKDVSLHTWNKVYEFMTVPTWAALISIIIALIPPLQAQVAGVRPFVAAVKSAGQCSIPLTLVVLGAFFYTPKPAPIALPNDAENIDHTIKGYFERKIRSLKGNGNSKEDKAYEGENRAVFVAVVSRMIVVPVLFLPLIALLAKEDYFLAAEDPVFILCAVLLVSSPPALTLAQLTQAASGDAFERLISKTISWSYAVLTPPLTLVYVVIGLVFAHL